MILPSGGQEGGCWLARTREAGAPQDVTMLLMPFTMLLSGWPVAACCTTVSPRPLDCCSQVSMPALGCPEPCSSRLMLTHRIKPLIGDTVYSHVVKAKHLPVQAPCCPSPHPSACNPCALLHLQVMAHLHVYHHYSLWIVTALPS